MRGGGGEGEVPAIITGLIKLKSCEPSEVSTALTVNTHVVHVVHVQEGRNAVSLPPWSEKVPLHAVQLRGGGSGSVGGLFLLALFVSQPL